MDRHPRVVPKPLVESSEESTAAGQRDASVHDVAGEDCLLVKVRAADTEALGRLLRDRLGRIDAITSTRTTIVLETVKESSALPIEAAPALPESVRV